MVKLNLLLKLILIIGLPGSGKSHLMNGRFSDKKTYQPFDDVNKEAVLNENYLIYSQNYPKIIADIIKATKNIVISDISFCDYKKYEHAIKILKWWIEKTGDKYKIINLIFENNTKKAKENIKENIKRNVDNRLRAIDDFSKIYFPEKYRKDDYEFLLIINRK